MAKLNFQKPLSQSSLSDYDPSEINDFGAQVKFLIITNIENSCAV